MSGVDIQIDFTQDAAWMDSIIRLPEVYEPMRFDGAPARKDMTVARAAAEGRHLFLRVRVDGQPVGFFMLERRGETREFEVHTQLSAACRGKLAIRAGRAAIDSAFQSGQVDLITSTCPDYNLQSLLFARLCGFERFGYRKTAFRRNGRQCGANLVCLSRKTWEERSKCQ
jgi:RimJ/RimL family protein N-acetyltransferase